MTLVPCNVPENLTSNRNNDRCYANQLVRQFLVMDIPCVEVTEINRKATTVANVIYHQRKLHSYPVKPVVRGNKVYLVNTTKVVLG